MNNLVSLVLTALFWMLSGLATALAGDSATVAFMPARFGDGPESLSQNVSCDNLGDEDAAVVFCQTWVEVDGRVNRDRTYCFNDSSKEQRKIAEKLAQSVQQSKFLPALVNGEAVPVFMSFRIALAKQEDQCKVITIPNLGYQAENFGRLYVAPQEIVTNGAWFSRVGIDRDIARRVQVARYRGMVFRMSVRVSADGAAADPVLERNKVLSRRRARSATRSLQESKFIPGFVDGMPAEMRYYEFLYFR